MDELIKAQAELGYKWVQGFEFDKEFADELTDATVLVLAHLSRKGAVYLQTDDSSEDYKLIEQLRRAVGDYAFFNITITKHELLVYIPERFDMGMSHQI